MCADYICCDCGQGWWKGVDRSYTRKMTLSRVNVLQQRILYGVVYLTKLGFLICLLGPLFYLITFDVKIAKMQCQCVDTRGNDK